MGLGELITSFPAGDFHISGVPTGDILWMKTNQITSRKKVATKKTPTTWARGAIWIPFSNELKGMGVVPSENVKVIEEAGVLPRVVLTQEG